MKLYDKHIFVCINQRLEGSPRKCCGEEKGNEIVSRFKALILQNGLKMKVRAQKASCFDWCEHGSIITIYPDKIVYGGVSIDDIDEIFESHILNNQPVARLKTKFSH